MQKKLLAVAVLSAFSGVAAAQSANVTLYGNIVQHVEWVGTSGGDGTAANAAAAGTGSSFRTATVSAAGVASTAVTANRVPVAGQIIAATFQTAPGVADQGGRFRFNPAGSHFGLRGNEDLGNGLSAWFQIELSANFGSNPPILASSEGRAPTMRNTGVGLRSNTWGTVLFGVWDTPFNMLVNGPMNANARINGASTSHGANLLGGNVLAQGAVSGQATQAWCAAAAATSAAQCINFGMNFDRRERSSIQWWSPNWNGFEVRAAYNVTQDNGGVTVNNQAGNRNALKQSIWDLTLAYTNGPLNIAYGYERQNDTLAAAARTFANGGITGGEANAVAGQPSGAWTMGTVGAAGFNGSFMSGSKGTGHRFGGKYAFSNGFGVGAMWESLKWDMTYGADVGAPANVTGAAQLLTGLKKTAWRLQGNYTTGSHFIALDYVRANAMAGSIGSATVAAANSFDGSSSGARAWQLNYNYALSKRTSIGAFYNTIRNETNAFYSGVVFAGVATPAGATANYTGMQLRHAF